MRPLVYNSTALDIESKLPIVVIDSAALINGELPVDLGPFIDILPLTNFVIVFFAFHAPKLPQINWLRRAHQQLPRELKKRIHKVFVVHATWYTRALNKALIPIVSPKFNHKIVFVKNLNQLNQFVPVKLVDVNPLVYIADENTLETTNTKSIFNMELSEVPCAYWNAALTFLKNCSLNEYAFAPMSMASDMDVRLVEVLFKGVEREQRLRLFDYGPFVVLQILKQYLILLKTPLIPYKMIEFPIVFSEEYAHRLMHKLNRAHRVHLIQLITFLKNAGVVEDVLARSMGPPILGLKNPNRQDVGISVRLLKVLLEHVNWKMKYSIVEKVEKSELEENYRFVDYSTRTRPRDLPDEVYKQPRVKIPNRPAKGRIAEIMRMFDETL